MDDASGFTSNETTTEQPRPLYRALPPAEAFPIAALGALRPAAEAIHLMTQAPLAMCAQAVLGVASLAARPHADVWLPHGARPLTCYFVTVAESGERKSSVDRLALRPVVEKEERLRGASEAEMQHFAAEKTAWEAARDEAKKLAKKGGKAAVMQALADLGPDPCQLAAWKAFHAELPWLQESDRALVEIACTIRGRMLGGEEMPLIALTVLRQCLSAMGATPADRSKVPPIAVEKPCSPEDKYFN